VTREQILLAQALYRVGDVVVTHETVPCYVVGGGRDGGAAPGWLWRVARVYGTEVGAGQALRYDCVAHTAPKMYRTTLRPKQIDRKATAEELTKKAKV
jgi:hypothetical protein